MDKRNGAMRVLLWLGITAFYLFSVLLHVEVGGFINDLFGSFSRRTYNNIVTSIVLIALFVLSIALYRSSRSKTVPTAIWLIVGYAIISIVLSFTVLFVIHIEAIHFLQYAILSFLLRKVQPSYMAAAILATLLGAYDELYQYLVLDTRANYYDFNDIFLDTTGTGLGLLGHWFCQEPAEKGDKRKWWQRLDSVLLVITLLLLFIMILMGEFTVNPKYDDPALFTLFKFSPEGFWHYPLGPYTRFHILRPIPGILLIVSSVFIYGFLDKVPIER